MKVGFIGLGTMGASMALNVAHEGRLRDDRARPAARSGAGRTSKARRGVGGFGARGGGGERRRVHVAAGPEGGRRRWPRSCSPACARAPRGSISRPTRRRWCGSSHARFAREGHRDAGRAGERRARGREERQARAVGGRRPAVFDKHKAVLDAIGDQAVYIGPIGAGTIAKLVHNCAGYAMLAALAEVFTMGVKAGVEPARAVGGGAPGRVRPQARVRPAGRAVPARASSTRPPSRSSSRTRTSRSPPSSAASSACR